MMKDTDEDFNRNVYVIQQCLFLYFIFCLALKDGLVRFYDDDNNNNNNYDNNASNNNENNFKFGFHKLYGVRNVGAASRASAFTPRHIS